MRAVRRRLHEPPLVTAPRILVAVAVLSTLAFAGATGREGATISWIRDVVLYNLPYLAGAVAGVWRARRARRGGEEYVAWLLLGAALFLYLLGNLFYTLVLAKMDEPAYPSWPDVGYLLFYPLVYVALVRLLRSRLTRWYRSIWLDGLIVALVLMAFGAQFTLAPILRARDDRVAATIIDLAYPAGDLLLLAILAGSVVLLGFRVDRSWAILAGGLIAEAIADSTYVALDTAGAYVEGGLVDLLYVSGATLLTLAAVVHADRPAGQSLELDSSTLSRGALMVAPIVGSAVGLALLAPVDAWGIAPLTRWFALAALMVSSARTVVTYREAISLRSARQEARTDDLTRLINRRGFGQSAPEVLKAALTAPTGNPRCAALLLLDLDGFKEVNDSLGHAAGDQLLAALAVRLATSVRGPEDLLARLGGDEFVLLLPGVDGAGALAAAARAHATLAEPIVVDGVRVQAAGSIGIALAPEQGTDIELLMRRADIAMYRAKSEHVGYAIFDQAENDADGEDKLQRIDEVREALASGQIEAHYQPKIDLATGEAIGVEALARWNCPRRGIVGPQAFLRLIESAGLMTQLTAIILDQALGHARLWRESGHDLVVSVNLHPASVVDEALPARVRDLLAQHDVSPRCLQLEITEESLLGDRVRARSVLAEIRASGVSIAIDDYGSGYSSLAYLRELPVDELKLDKAFVLPMSHDPRAAAIVRSTIELAHALGLRIVAEGVENATAASDLTSFGCDTAQGYHYAKALPAHELNQWLDQRQSPTSVPPVATETEPVPQVTGG